MSTQGKNKKTLGRLLLFAVGMVGFSFALVPLYNVFCSVTGLNGKTGGKVNPVADMKVQQRQIRLEFLTMENGGLNANFHSRHSGMDLHPGKIYLTDFHVKNKTDKDVVFQAVPSIAPGELAAYLHKTECFCFTQQKLKPGEEKWMPVRFFLDTDFPQDYKELTLQYTLFDVTSSVTKNTGTGN